MSAPALAIVVATRTRAPALRRMLASARAMPGADGPGFTLVIADNDSRDDTRAVVEAAAAAHPAIRYLAVPSGGKTHALNVAIRATDAPVLAFTDDDVEFDPGWLAAVRAYFARTAAAAAQGVIRIPPAAARDPALAAAVERWRTVPRCDLGAAATETRSFIGANMLVARATFARVGLFDERLGPGAAGASEDTELARRILAAGLRIGYIPDAIVYHEVDPSRLGPAYFRDLHERRGRSRIYYKRTGPARFLPNLGLAALGIAWGAVTGRSGPRTRALGRWYHYRSIMAARRRPRLPGSAPPLEGA